VLAGCVLILLIVLVVAFTRRQTKPAG
jgi:hypothetical protein